MTSASEDTSMRRRARRLGRALSVLSFLLLVAEPTRAERSDPMVRTAARELAIEGMNAFEAGDYAGALDRFQRAHALYAAPSLSVMEARCLVRLGRWVEALDRYEATQRARLEPNAPEAYKRAVADAVKESDDLRPRVPRLIISVTGTGPKKSPMAVRLDGRELPDALVGVALPVDPGRHELSLHAADHSPATRAVTLEEGEHETIVLEPGPRVADTTDGKASVRERLGWIAIGAGGLALTTGIVTGARALSIKSSADERCAGGPCPAGVDDDLDSYSAHRTASFVAFGLGAAALAAGGYLLWFDSGAGDTQVALWPTGASVRGSF
ncbi:MAG TPA: hypothetical protein VKY73_00615 [Polyangiaceae bacterium]|nr:hypothetical protein [Polyangiaceae bacterium]